MTIHSIGEAQNNFQGLIDDETVNSHKPIIITSDGPNAVLLSEEDWSSIRETLYVLSIPDVHDQSDPTKAKSASRSSALS